MAGRSGTQKHRGGECQLARRPSLVRLLRRQLRRRPRLAVAQRGQSELHGLYVALPFCRAKCSYCNFASGVFPLRRQEEYCRALIRELELTLAGLGGGRLLVDTM